LDFVENTRLQRIWGRGYIRANSIGKKRRLVGKNFLMRGGRVFLSFLVVALICATSLQAEATAGLRGSDPIDESFRLSQTAKGLLALDPPRASALAETAGRLASEGKGDPYRRALAIATSQWVRGDASLRLNNPAAAKTLLAEAFYTVSRLQAGSALQGDILLSRARLESTTNEVQAALADYLAAFEVYKLNHDNKKQAVTLQDIGLLYHDAGDYKRSLGYYAESRATYSGDPILDLSVDNNRAESLGDLGQYREAEAEYDSALRIAERLGSPSLEAQIVSNLAIAQISDDQYAAAGQSVERGLKLARSEAASQVLPTLLSTRAQLDLREGRIAAAGASVDAIPEKSGADLASESDEWVHRTKYEVYKAQGRSQDALRELETFEKIQDGHRMLMSSANTALMAARFDFDNQNARISALKTGELKRDIALTRLRALQGQIVLGGLLVIFTVGIIFLVFYLTTLRKSNRQTRKVNTQLSESNAKLEDALQAKTQFLATTSHEIRTPLNGVLGMTEVLLAGEELSKGVRQRVALIHGAGEAMRTLVDDLLDMSKMDAGQIVLQRDTVDLPALLSEISRFWLTHAESAGLELSLDITGAPTMIREDARRLRQILSNLLSNAVKFTPAGSIVMSARATAVDDRERLLIRVSDSGIGVAEGSREMIFEKFTQLDASITRKYGGTGLGLSIARSLARAMGGDIKAESNAAGGADFVVTLPLERVPIDDVSERGSKAVSHALIDLRVMIVEHNPITQGALRSLLERRVDCVSFSSTIPEAIEQMGPNAAHVVIASFPKEGRSPDGATDRQMSDLARACRRTGVKLVIILGPADMAGVLSLQLLGASYLERPISAIKLAEHLEGLHDSNPHLSALRA
jgi:signal transduction histidine kinase